MKGFHGTVICLISAYIFCLQPIFAYTVAKKFRSLGPSIHRTYFTTPNNQPVVVKAQAYLGNFSNGICPHNLIFDLGNEVLKTGDYIEFDAFKIKTYFGISYDCMTVYYTHQQFVTELLVLFFDGINFYGTFPTESRIRII